MDRAFSETDTLDLAETYSESLSPAREQALDACRFSPGSLGLDLGCGAGVPLRQIAGRLDPGARIIGMDISPKQLERAAVRLQHQTPGAQIELVEGDATRALPFEDSTFDWVWTENALWGGMIGKDFEVLREIQRVLKPGGKIAFFYGNMYRATMLPGVPQLEHKLYLADALRWFGEESASLEKSHENASGWLRSVGFEGLEVSTHLVEYSQPLPEFVAAHLRLVWSNNFGDSLEPFAMDAGVSDEHWALWQRMRTPGTREYLLDQPDFRVVRTATLTHGVKRQR